MLLDVVYNHAGYESHYLTDPKTKGWLRSSEHGDCGDDDVTSCVAGLPDFKTEQPEVAKYLLDAQLGWAKPLGVDGFRLDTVKHVAHDSGQEHRRRARAELGPGFFLLGEVWGGDPQVLDPWFERDELDAGFDFAFQGSALAFVEGRGRTVAFDRYLQSREKVRPGYLLAHFLSSHDVPGGLFQLDGARRPVPARGRPPADLRRDPDDLLRRGGRPARGRLARQPERHAVGRSRRPPREGPAAERGAPGRLRAAHRDPPGPPRASRGAHQGLVTDGDVYVFSCATRSRATPSSSP